MTPPSYDGPVFEVPTSLSPSRVEKFTSCPLAFRFASIEKLPEPPSIHATRGSLVHRALELAYSRPAAERRRPSCSARSLAAARDEYRALPDFTGLGLDDEEAEVFDEECRELVETTCTMEDPRPIHPIGLELRLSADVGPLALRGIIDRLELRDGELVVTDYKTGRAPSVNWEQKSLAGVHFYSFLCEQVLGRRPVAIRLMYLQQRRDHRGHAVGAVDAVHHHPHDGGVEGRRAGLRHRRLPAPAERAVRVVRVPAVVPGVRRRPRAGRRRGRRRGLDAGRSSRT